MELAARGGIELFISQAILDETLAVLRREKFKRSKADIAKAESIIRELTQLVEPTQQIDAVAADPPDNKIIECAVACKADVIVSGDQHLLKLGQYERILVMTVQSFFRRIEPRP